MLPWASPPSSLWTSRVGFCVLWSTDGQHVLRSTPGQIQGRCVPGCPDHGRQQLRTWPIGFWGAVS